MLISGLVFASLLGLLWILGGVVVVSCLVVSIFFYLCQVCPLWLGVQDVSRYLDTTQRSGDGREGG